MKSNIIVFKKCSESILHVKRHFRK